MTDVISHREAVQVQLDTFTLWCESCRVTGSAVHYEQPTVTGKTVVTNRYRRSSELTFTGRVYGSASAAIAALSALTADSSGFDTAYRDLILTGCTVRSFTAEDDGSDVVKLTVTVVTPDDITRRGADSA
ncbi:MAG TPA: hypothetical protein DCZ71_07470 [Ruminococcus sp.]|nr:hypothetical protein [Ruminococcus sp.]